MKNKSMFAFTLCMCICIAHTIAYAKSNTISLSTGAIHLEKKGHNEYLSIAQVALEENRLSDAIVAYQALLEFDLKKKQKYRTYMSLGSVYLQKLNYSAAIEAYLEAVRLYPKDEDARFLLAQSYEKSELYELAQHQYDAIVRRHKRSFRSYCGLGNLSCSRGNYTSAMEHYRKALTIRSDKNVYRKLAECAHMLGDNKLSVAMLKQAIGKEGLYDDYISLGLLHQNLHMSKDAEKAFSASIQINPKRLEGYIYLSILYIQENRFKEAEQLLIIATEHNKEDALPHFFLSQVYYAIGDIKKSWRELAETKKYSRSEMVRHYIGKFEVYLQKNKKNEKY